MGQNLPCFNPLVKQGKLCGLKFFYRLKISTHSIKNCGLYGLTWCVRLVLLSLITLASFNASSCFSFCLLLLNAVYVILDYVRSFYHLNMVNYYYFFVYLYFNFITLMMRGQYVPIRDDYIYVNFYLCFHSATSLMCKKRIIE